MTAVLALLRFQVATGARLALRLLVPWTGVAVVAIGMQEDPGRALLLLAASLAGPGWLVVGALGLAIAWWAAPLILASDAGWLGHLPASRRARRGARIGALLVVQGPLLAAASGLVLLETTASGPRALVGLGTGPLVALLASVAAEIGLGFRSVRVRGPRLPLSLEVRAFGHAAGSRAGEALLVAALPVAASMLFVRNNVLPASHSRLGLTLGGGLGVASILATLGVALRTRRPPWAWARSLPVGSRRRVRRDAILLALHAVLPCLAVAWLDPWAGGVLLGALPLLSLGAAAAIRRRSGDRGTGGLIAAEGAAAAGLLALAPWLVVVAVALVPAALGHAAARDRELRVR